MRGFGRRSVTGESEKIVKEKVWPKRKPVSERKPVGGQPRTKRERAERLTAILKILEETYPNPECALRHSNPWELLVATILSAQCTDERVNMVTPALFAKYPSIQSLAAANVEEVAQIVRSTGFFNNKAKNIVGAAQRILEAFDGEVPRTMEELLTVPGAARKTANVVLGSGYGIASGVVVDTHVQRVARRLAFTNETDPVRIERDLMALIPQERWINFSHELILHGRALCFARKPNCPACPLDPLCFAADKTSTEVAIEKKTKQAKPASGGR